MRAAKHELPVTAQTGDYTGVWAELGDMHYAFETCAGGYDMDALVKIFPDHACPVEHWGYVFRGKVRVEYTDGHEEILSAGDAFYTPSTVHTRREEAVSFVSVLTTWSPCYQF